MKRKQDDVIRKRKSRVNKNSVLKNICQKYPDIKKDLKFRENKIGRPRVEVDQPEILKAIIDIAAVEGAADARPRRQSES